MNAQKRELLGSAWMILAALLFTLMNVLLKKVANFGYSTSELVFWRMLFSVFVLGAMIVLRGQTLKTPHWKKHLSRSVSGTLAMCCTFYTLVNLPLATGTMLGYTSSIFLALLSWIVLKEKISGYTQMILAMGFVGVVLLLNPSFASGQEGAAVIGLLGGVLSGWAYLQVRELSLLGEPAWRVVFYFSAVGMVLAAALTSLQTWHALTWQAIPYLLGIGAAALLAQLAMTTAYQVGRKFTVASLAYLTVVFSALAGMFLFDEIIGWQEIAGIAIIIGAGVLSGLKK
ncbi:MAG: DMT family transporter [Neisseria sp.]|nr:DMT family transporter [Neisseria sp.]